MVNQFMSAVFGVILTVIGLGLLGSSLIATIEHLDKQLSRLPDSDQKLATECYVDSKIPSKEEKKYTHFFYDGKQKRECNVVDALDDKVKVEYMDWEKIDVFFDGRYTYYTYTPLGKPTQVCSDMPSVTKWLPKQEVYKVLSLEEISERLAKKK